MRGAERGLGRVCGRLGSGLLAVDTEREWPFGGIPRGYGDMSGYSWSRGVVEVPQTRPYPSELIIVVTHEHSARLGPDKRKHQLSWAFRTASRPTGTEEYAGTTKYPGFTYALGGLPRKLLYFDIYSPQVSTNSPTTCPKLMFRSVRRNPPECPR